MLKLIRKHFASIKSFAPYIIATVLCLSSNFIYFKYLVDAQKKEDLQLLDKHIKDITSSIIRNFKLNAQSDNGNNTTFFTYFNDNTVMGNRVASKYKNAYIAKTSKVVVLNKPVVEEFINNLLPSYVGYKILFNKTYIASSHVPKSSNKVHAKYQIDHKNKFLVELDIDKKHPDYLKIINEIYKRTATTFVSSLIIVLTILYFYLNRERQISTKFKELENNLKETKEELEAKLENAIQLKDALIQQLQHERNLRRMFIKTATAIYLDHNIPDINNDQKHTNDELSGFLFPITFTEPANNEEIDVNQVIKDLTGYLSYDATKYDIRINKQADSMKVQCSKAVFYQILFSLVSNLILLMPQLSDSPPLGYIKKKFTVTFQEEKIIIDFETFPLNSEQIASFADKKIPVDAFFLDYKRVVESMKIHNIDYCVTSGKTGNRYELEFKKKIPKGKPNLRLVE